ncbi:acyl-CoA thioesterase [Psychrobacter sp. FDAARGOS_221]|uniref:acyl-CoA thioesterase n=1 Tax=Psychrobacter sp. FDAARGOS_221 TaxID=1975705 RepID=UPI000BB56C39|nr:acyl-CoA thioesterase [Psychrobacter sp. FDAARGOS_221]PNK60117.1 acyl-CoA thioesterase [Psychrobacter sp. FDAARGOS_221]
MNMLIRFAILLNLLRQEQAKNDSIDLERLKAPFSRRYRVLPHDMGFRNHVPNYRYLSFIELNVTGWLYQILKQQGKGGLSLNWIISMQEMVYLKEVKFLDKLTVTSTLEGWDDKYLYFQHHFYVKNKLMAIGLTKFILVNKKGKQSPEVLGLQGEQLTEVISTWNANQTAIKSQ